MAVELHFIFRMQMRLHSGTAALHHSSSCNAYDKVTDESKDNFHLGDLGFHVEYLQCNPGCDPTCNNLLHRDWCEYFNQSIDHIFSDRHKRVSRVGCSNRERSTKMVKTGVRIVYSRSYIYIYIYKT